MASINIYASKSLTVTNKIPKGNIREEKIYIGREKEYRYISYLYFDLSPVPASIKLLSASLILFSTGSFEASDSKYMLIPLSDHFSSYTSYERRPEYAGNRYIKPFNSCENSIYAEINIEEILSLWLKGKLSNKGIALLGNSSSILTSYGSAYCEDNSLIPFLSICYDSKELSVKLSKEDLNIHITNKCDFPLIPLSTSYTVFPPIKT